MNRIHIVDKHNRAAEICSGIGVAKFQVLQIKAGRAVENKISAGSKLSGRLPGERKKFNNH